MKRCIACQKEKSLDNFSPNALGAQGRYPRCKPCNNRRNTDRRRRKAEAEGRPWPSPTQIPYASEADRIERIARSARRDHLKRKYGMTVQDYDRMVEDQNGRCAICSRRQEDCSKGVLHIDHCHEVGTVRALLCNFCNQALGLFRHDPELVKAAIAYLKRHADVMV